VAVIDVAGYIADLKVHVSEEHGFHVHDERHLVETYSLMQVWEVDLHPEEGCDGPLDLHLTLEVDPRMLLSFEDRVKALPDHEDPPESEVFQLTLTWEVNQPLRRPPDLLVLATELAGIGGLAFPVEVSAIDSYNNVTDAPERVLKIVARRDVSLARIFLGDELLCDVWDHCRNVSSYMMERAPMWLGE
jgi:hypothetical protein